MIPLVLYLLRASVVMDIKATHYSPSSFQDGAAI